MGEANDVKTSRALLSDIRERVDSPDVHRAIGAVTGWQGHLEFAGAGRQKHDGRSNPQPHRSSPHFIAYSAGIDPAGDLDPETRELFEAMGYPADNLHPKHYRDFGAVDAQKLDFVFTLSDTAAGEPLPEWPGLPVTAHWASSDPVKATGEPWERKQAFSRTMAELDRRLKIFVNLPLGSLDRLSIQSHVDKIGQSKGED